MPYRIIGPDDPALNVLCDELQRHPEWDTDLLIIPWAEYRDRLMDTLTAETAPDQAVCVPGHIWIPELVDLGYLAPLDSLFDDSLLNNYQPDEILPAIAAESRFAGRQYMLPLFTDGHILFYRSDLLTLPTTDTETVPVISPLSLHELASRVHNPPQVYGLALKAHPSEIFLDWLPFLWAAGGDVLDEAGLPAFAGKAGVRALQYYCDLRQFCPPNTHTFGNAEIAEVIKTGQAALVTTWGGQSAAVVLAEDNAFKENYRTAVFPKPWNATWGVSIPANQPEAVQRAITSVLLQAAGPAQDRDVTRVAGSPVRHSSYAPDELARFHWWLPAQYEMLKRTGLLPTDPKFGAVLGTLYTAVAAAFNGETSPQAALSQAEQSARQLLR
jgi:multiple sugar transport system substrate-binding protein